MKTTISIILFLSACSWGGTENNGLVIETNSFPIQEELVKTVFQIVETNWNNRFSDDLDLISLAENEGLFVEYVSNLPARGQFYSDSMMIRIHFS